jgi:hypothetical protein
MSNSAKVFLKIKFLTSVPEFWVCVKVECKEFSEEAMEIFISFAASFLCETRFPAGVAT